MKYFIIMFLIISLFLSTNIFSLDIFYLNEINKKILKTEINQKIFTAVYKGNGEFLFWDEIDGKIYNKKFSVENSKFKLMNNKLYKIKNKCGKFFVIKKLKNFKLNDEQIDIINSNIAIDDFINYSVEKYKERDKNFFEENSINFDKFTILRNDKIKIILCEGNDLPPFGENQVFRKLKAFVILTDEIEKIFYFVEGYRLE